MAGATDDVANDKATDVTLMMPAATEQEKEIGCKATEDFSKKDYEACLVSIEKLLSSRPNDPKVLHNKAIAEYYLSGLRNYDAFMASLNKVSAMMRLNMNAIETPDDVDQCVVYYNQAVMLYHTKKYAEALALMEALYQFLEPVAEEQLSRKSHCLLVDLYISMHQPEKALELISDVDKLLPQSGKPSAERENSAASGSKENKDAKTDDDSTAAAETWKMRMVLYKIQCCLACKNLKLCKRELKSLGSTSNPTAVYMKANYEYLRANSLKAMRLLNSASPATASSARSLIDVAPSMHYNNLGCVHAQLRKHNLASFYFKKALMENEGLARDLRLDSIVGHSPTGRPLYSLAASRHYELLHNAGIQLLHCGRPLPAFDCLIEAVKVYSTNPRLWLRIAECCVMAHRKNNDEDRSLESRRRVIETVVGSGVHRKIILGTGKADARAAMESAAMPAATLQFASLCLQNALHLLAAAACASVSEATTSATSIGGTSSFLSQLPSDQASGSSSQLLSGEGSSSTGSGGGSAGTGSGLLPQAPTHLGTAASGSNGVRAADCQFTAAPPSSPMKASEVLQLKCSVLANSAYVALCMGDHLLALRHSEALLAMPVLSPAHRYVAQMYAAEANARMDMIAEAIQKLVPDSVTDIAVLPTAAPTEIGGGGGGGSGMTGTARAQTATVVAEHDNLPGVWVPADVPKAKAIMSYNLAVCYAVRGEFEKATASLSLCLQNIGNPPPAQVYSLRLYLNLVEGKRKLAHGIIKEHFGHVTPNRL